LLNTAVNVLYEYVYSPIKAEIAHTQ